MHDDGCCPLCGRERAVVDVTVDGVTLSGMQISKGGLSVVLGPVQFDILRAMAERPGKPWTHGALFQRVYGDRDEPPDDKTIQVHIHHLRRIVGWDGIETRWGKVVIFHPSRVILDPDQHPVPAAPRLPLSQEKVHAIRTMVGRGLNDAQIGRKLKCSPVTVRKYRRKMTA